MGSGAGWGQCGGRVVGARVGRTGGSACGARAGVARLPPRSRPTSPDGRRLVGARRGRAPATRQPKHGMALGPQPRRVGGRFRGGSGPGRRRLPPTPPRLPISRRAPRLVSFLFCFCRSQFPAPRATPRRPHLVPHVVQAGGHWAPEPTRRVFVPVCRVAVAPLTAAGGRRRGGKKKSVGRSAGCGGRRGAASERAHAPRLLHFCTWAAGGAAPNHAHPHASQRSRAPRLGVVRASSSCTPARAGRARKHPHAGAHPCGRRLRGRRRAFFFCVLTPAATRLAARARPHARTLLPAVTHVLARRPRHRVRH